MTRITENIEAVRDRIDAAARRFGRDPAEIAVVAVSKRHPAASILEACRAGLADFGENFYQEAEGKIRALEGQPLRWHFIGRLQSNKTRGIAELFDWVHTVDRPRIAERLSAQRPHYAAPLQVCLQVRAGSGSGRPGAAPESLAALAGIVAGLPRLRLRGLMCMPAPETGFDAQRIPFRMLADCAASLRAAGFGIDTLSMGMTGDLEAAIAEGATRLRIGTAIFGPRPG